MKTIIERIEAYELTPENDIDGAGGFFDLASTKAKNIVLALNVEYNYYKSIRDILFKDYWDIYKEATGYIDQADIPF